MHREADHPQILTSIDTVVEYQYTELYNIFFGNMKSFALATLVVGLVSAISGVTASEVGFYNFHRSRSCPYVGYWR